MYRFEEKLWAGGFDRIAGVDEAGRGPLAGPVVAGAVVLPRLASIPGIQDSKQLTPEARDRLFVRILRVSEVGIGFVGHETIDSLNILQASRLAMLKAIQNLARPPQFVLVDGRMKLDLSVKKMEIVRGDSLSASIAAASIIAKVTRDRIMFAYHELYPEFAFDAHKGYGTRKHLTLLNQWGPCRIHRLSFRPVRACRPSAGWAPGHHVPTHPVGEWRAEPTARCQAIKPPTAARPTGAEHD